MALGTKKTGPIAIDFGSFALRALQLSHRGDKKSILHRAEHIYASRTGTDGIERSETVEALRRILQTKKFAGKQVISAFGRRDLITKCIRLPEIPESELGSAVNFEAAERMNGLGTDAEVRFISSGALLGESERQLEILVLAAKAEVVREHLDLLSELGLESVGIDAAPCAVFRPFEQYIRREADQDQVNAFVDIGQASSWVVIARGNRIVLARSVDVGGSTFDSAVGDELSLDLKEASELRRRVAKNNVSTNSIDANTVEAVAATEHPQWEKLGREIGLCTRYFAVTFRGARPNSVTCVGGGSLNEQLLTHLSKVTGMTCRVGFPLRNISSAVLAGGNRDEDSLAEWATCAGLALKPVISAFEKVCQ